MSAELQTQLQKTLGDAYRLERELGGGGMSRVFLAEELRLERSVVVKVLSPDLAQGISADRFEREIRTVAALQQANIVPVLTAGETDGLPFYTMPYVEGESLRARLANGRLAATDVVSIMKDVAKALAYAHQRGVVHRDIKPDNVLLSGGTAVVTDFGIAKAISSARTASESSTLTQVGTSIGTPAYMAPEQAAGDANVDHRADIYALGAMAYELLAGHPVFPDRSAQRMLAAHMSELPRPISELRPDVPAPLAELVMQCLAKDPSGRPSTASDVTRVLESATSGGLASMPPALIGGVGMFRKALLVYAAAFIAVAILSKVAIGGIGLPEWVFSGSLIVMGLGLPVVLWTGYVQRVARAAMTATPTFTPGGSPAAATHGTIANIALRAAPNVSWSRTARRGVLALGVFVAAVAGFMMLRASGVPPFGSLFASGSLRERDMILLTDFATHNVDSSLGPLVSDAVRAALSTSSAFTLMSPSAIVAALARMERSQDARLEFATARELAQREGVKAIVDGRVTGVDGGYVVAIRLVRADSGIVLASFQETGSGPRGLIDAADRLARDLRSRAGESLRDVNATPGLAQATTGSLEALQKYSEASRANALGDRRALTLIREAVAIDSTFASGWSALAANLSNYGATQSAIDSAITNAYRYRARLPWSEQSSVTARYFGMGPGRDRAKAIAAYEEILRRGDTTSAVLINLAEQLRSRREFARAESLNVAALRISPNSGTALGNTVEMQLNQGRVEDAAATAEQLKRVAIGYGTSREVFVLHIAGDDKRTRAKTDSLLRAGGSLRDRIGVESAVALAVRDGRLRDATAFAKEDAARRPRRPEEVIFEIELELAMKGPSPSLVRRLDSAVASTPFASLPMVDRPYFPAATALARAGQVEKARAMVARYRAEVKDTSLLRVGRADLHYTLGQIAIAAGKMQEAVTELRLGDVGYDGAPAMECAPCLSFDLARAFDAGGMADSAIVMFEQYLATPFWLKPSVELDPVRVPAIRERLGQLYESKGNVEKAAENYRAFIDLWKNADPELQPRVADARQRLARLMPVEKAKR